MLKKLLKITYLLTTSSLSFAAGISTMNGDASLSDTTTNWNPAFVDGNTIVVGAENISLTTDASKTIGAIRLDNTLSYIGYYANSQETPTIGSIAGTAKLTQLQTAGSGDGQIWTFTGAAGVGNNPRANDYSGLSEIQFSYTSTLNINAPVTINSTFSTSLNLTTNLNINDNVIITHNSIANIDHSKFSIASDKSLALSGSDMTLTSSFNFNDSGKLILSGANTVFNPNSVSNISNAVLNIDNNVTTNMPSVLTINTINIADSKSMTIDAINGNMDLLNNNTKIVFLGNNSELILANSSTVNDRTFTLYSNLLSTNDGTTISDNYGNVTLVATVKNSTINSNSTETIGQDNTHRFQKLTLTGVGNVAINPKIFVKQIVMDSTGTVTVNNDLDTGNGGEILFSSDGALVASKGVTGSVTTSADKAGTITIGAGDVGAIGADGKSLKLVHLNQGAAANIGKLYATSVDIGGAGPITSTDLMTSAVSFSSNGTLIASKGITGNIDFAGKAGVLQLADSQTITGNVDSTAASAGTLEFLGKGAVTGTIGATNALTSLKFSGAGDTTIPAAKAKTVEVANAAANITATDVITGDVLFSSNGTLVASKGIAGNIDFAGNSGVINVADNVNISGGISSTDSSSGIVNFLGSSTVGGIVSNISTVRAGTGDVTFQPLGDYSIGELQGNGNGTITFSSGMNFVGGINTSGGAPINLSFADGTNINGNIGSKSSPVGNISSGHNTKFTGDINSSGDVITSGSTIFANSVTCNNIIANKSSSNIFSLSLTTLTSALSTSSDNTIDFDDANAVTQFQSQVSTIGNIEVNGNTYFADTVNSQGNVIINGDTKFNKTLSSNNNILISSDSNVIFNGDVSSSSITIDNAKVGIVDNISMQGNIDAVNSSIMLDKNTLTLSGHNTFSDHMTISSSYDESSLSGGNIILTSGSTLDLSNVSELTIKLAFINSDISKIDNNTKYHIILVEDRGSIIPLNDPKHQITLDSSGEQNKFVKWVLDTNALTLYVSDDSNNVIDNDYVFDSQQNNMFMQELKNILPNSDAQKLKNNLGLLSKEQVEDILSRILDHPKERSSNIARVALHQALEGTNRTTMNVIHDRLLDTGSTATSAGDEDVNKYGVWVRSSINHSKDKVSGKDSEYFSSYKTRGHSNTIGVDGLIRDNILVGVAYTNAYTGIRPKDHNIGNVDKVRTNMVSLYSAYNIPNYNWYLDSTISYAESSIKGYKRRNLAIAKNILGHEVASSKYKSHLYSGSVSLGYNHFIGNNIYIAPSLGAMGSLIRDKGYTETGTSFQNLTIHKKHYTNLSGNVGLRAYQNIYIKNKVGSAIITPELYGYVNYNIKNKSPSIDARLTGIDEPLPTISHRSNRVDYNLGLGITLRQNMMEYGINYGAILAKKYQGHSGSLKVKVNL